MEPSSALATALAPAPPTQKPSVGRIVHYLMPDGTPRPAMVVVYWDPKQHPGYQRNECNLRVMLDGNNDHRRFEDVSEWQTSVPQGDAPGEWQWPPRA